MTSVFFKTDPDWITAQLADKYYETKSNKAKEGIARIEQDKQLQSRLRAIQAKVFNPQLKVLDLSGEEYKPILQVLVDKGGLEEGKNIFKGREEIKALDGYIAAAIESIKTEDNFESQKILYQLEELQYIIKICFWALQNGSHSKQKMIEKQRV